MATLIQIRDKANAVLSNLLPIIQQKESEYFAKHGKYFSLMASQSVKDGVDTLATPIPPDDEKNVSDVTLTFDSPLPFQIRIDEWAGETVGYQISVWIELLDGDIWSRSRDINGVDSNWYKWFKIV